MLVGNGGADVPRRIVPIRRHRNEQIGSRRFGDQLILDKEFAGQVQDSRPAQSQADDIQLVAGLTATHFTNGNPANPDKNVIDFIEFSSTIEFSISQFSRTQPFP